MKKQVYIAPATTSVDMELEGMVAQSLRIASETVDSELGFAVREERTWASPSSVMDNEW